MSNFDRQIERETCAVAKGVERFYTQLNRDKEKGREFDGPVGQSLTRELMQRFVPEVEALHKEAMKAVTANLTTGQRKQSWHDAILMLPAPEAAYIAIRTGLSAAGSDDLRTRLVLAKRIGRMINLEVRWRTMRAAEAARDKEATEPPYNRLKYLLRETRQINARSVSKWLRKLTDIETAAWDHRLQAEVGMPILLRLIDTCDHVFAKHQYVQQRFGRANTVETVRISDAARARLAAEYKDYAQEHPWLMPMICPPLYWQRTEEGWSGGYLRLCDGELFKSTPQHKHTPAILDEVEVPKSVLDALNAVQATAWRINSAVLDVCQEAHARGVLEVLPVTPHQELPAKLTTEEWEALTPEERGAIRNARRVIYDSNFRLASKREAAARQLAVAHDLRNEPEIFFPHNMDFRGRLYPLPQDLHPQADDMGKSLLTFSAAKQLGAGGLAWLGYHAANCYGMDKLTRAEQAGWVEAHAELIRAVAADPFGEGLWFWSKAEEKWQFLAAALELVAAWDSGNPEAYYSRLPVHVDGSCNGLQHLSAMGLDPVGAHATNLTPDPTRQDIYQIVADEVQRSVEADAAAGSEPAKAWLGKVTRKTVKRGVMTVPYGLTEIGMRDQLINDGWTSELDGDHQTNANYLRDRMLDAIHSTVHKAAAIMEWMQGNAEILAKNHKPVRWVTPAGLVVQQGYTRAVVKRIYTVLGVGAHRTTDTRMLEAGDLYRVTKQVSSVVPNIIHSFDAAHLMMTMAAAPAGVCISAVHDSFGCHAADMPAFLDVIRDQFVAIYNQDWFAKLQQDFEASRGTDTFPLLPPPRRGKFDISAVRDAPFFFA